MQLQWLLALFSACTGWCIVPGPQTEGIVKQRPVAYLNSIPNPCMQNLQAKSQKNQIQEFIYSTLLYHIYKFTKYGLFSVNLKFP